MKYQIAIFALLMILIPLVSGCKLQPEDQWPVIATEAIDANFTVTAALNTDLGIIQFKVARESFDVAVDIRSYNANQGFDVKLILLSIDKYSTDYSGESLVSVGEPFMTEPFTTRFENLIGDYIEGTPPQGTARIKFSNSPGWFPTSLGDWVQGSTVTDKYVYNYMVIIEDMHGRTDSFDFFITSTLAL